MVKRPYDWQGGAKLEEHSRRKHKIVRDYFFEYIDVRCQLPQQSKFRLAVVDGFAGEGRYDDASAGSPLIFIEELARAFDAVNIRRAVQGVPSMSIECLLIFNDNEPGLIAKLKVNVAALISELIDARPDLHVRVEYMADSFERAYSSMCDLLSLGGYRNVIFNLDQYGHSSVDINDISDIMRRFASPEIFYTFSINSLTAFLSKRDPVLRRKQLARLRLEDDALQTLDSPIRNSEWLSIAERVVFSSFEPCARYVSPFSINNPDGWEYWLLHFSNSYRARQVYNNLLHTNTNTQAHFGRAGLEMLAYDPSKEGQLYLFDDEGRARAKDQLVDDIARVVTDGGDTLQVLDFYEGVYNATPAHMDDIHTAIVENPELQVITPKGGKRQKPGTISINDFLKRDAQLFFPMFMGSRKDKK